MAVTLSRLHQKISWLIFVAMIVTVPMTTFARQNKLLRGEALVVVAIALDDFNKFLGSDQSGCRSLAEFELEVSGDPPEPIVVEFVRITEGKGCGATYRFPKASERTFERLLHK